MAVVIAHRGASGYLPEHTLQAKQLAFEMGADYLEQDIVASRDDELLVLHDIHLDRISDVSLKFPGRQRADGRFYVRDFDLEEIRSLSAWERMHADGSPVYPDRYPPRSGNFRLHTLEEELQLVARLNAEHGREVGIYPEIKRPAWHRGEGIDIGPQLLATLADHGYAEPSDPVFVQCFNADELRRLKVEFGCPLRLIQLVGEHNWLEPSANHQNPLSPAGLATIAEFAAGIGPHLSQLFELAGVNGVPVAGKVALHAHEAGLLVHPYTFRADDLPAGFASFDDLVDFFVAEVKVDGLFTDFPDKVVALLRP